MGLKYKILKINQSGDLVAFNISLQRFELVSQIWSWEDITKGYIRESKRNYKNNNDL